MKHIILYGASLGFLHINVMIHIKVTHNCGIITYNWHHVAMATRLLLVTAIVLGHVLQNCQNQNAKYTRARTKYWEMSAFLTGGFDDHKSPVTNNGKYYNGVGPADGNRVVGSEVETDQERDCTIM